MGDKNNYILGTAGHVDHGKTALIKALTGMETSRLPEEKKRGMTIELGFAALEDAVHGTVGIVDVPGHERFIRNMVAGAWGLDAAMLVVAADDGWMRMSSDHLRILKAMKVDSVLLVITKSDLAEKEMLELIIEDANRHCMEILGRTLPAVAVSSLTGEGIEELKKAISALLTASKRKKIEKSFLYIDRVFTLKGIGVTITGTLRGGKITCGDVLNIYPGNIECRIKNIQNHNQDINEIRAASRTALNLKLPEKAELRRGMLISGEDGEPVLYGKEFLIRIDEIFYGVSESAGESEGLKNHAEMEIALGSAHAIGSLHLNSFDKTLGRFSLTEPLACAWNQEAVLIRHGGSEILASCRVLAAFSSYKRTAFKDAFKIYNGRELPSWQSYLFNLSGCIEKKYAKPAELSSKKEEIADLGSFWVSAEKLKNWQDKILAVAKNRQAGFTAEETDLPLPAKVRTSVLKKLCDEEKLVLDGHIYMEKGRTGADISKTAKQILQTALAAGDKGIESDKLNFPQAKKEVRDLVKLGLLICIEDFLHYHKDVFEQVCSKILKGRKPGDRIAISDAREITGLSRKYILPIFNLLEKAGKLKREENDRIVI